MLKLSQMLKIQSTSKEFAEMHSYIISVLKSIAGVQWEQDRIGNIYAVKGKADEKYPAFVCHTDTSKEIRPNFDVLRLKHNFWMAYVSKDDDELHHVPIGGAKTGIYICLKLLTELPTVKVAFYIAGDSGQNGATNSKISFFDDCRWVLECDRKGNKDIITVGKTVDLASENFKADLFAVSKKYKFDPPTYGGDTDIVALKEDLKLGVSCANISSGFWGASNMNEQIVEGHLNNTLFFCKAVAQKLTDVYPHHYEKKAPHSPSFGRTFCRMDGCVKTLFPSEDTICTECAIKLRIQRVVCRVCSGELMSGSQLYYQQCREHIPVLVKGSMHHHY